MIARAQGVTGQATVEVVAASSKVAVPFAFRLYPNAPNPFNPETEIRYELPSIVHRPSSIEDFTNDESRMTNDGLHRVTLVVYNLSGQVVRTLVDGEQGAGSYQVAWNGRDEAGREVASGVYLYRLQAGAFGQTRRMVLVR